jgi:hypothetical protein
MGFRRLPRAFFWPFGDSGRAGCACHEWGLGTRQCGRTLFPRKCPVPRTRPPKSFQQPALSWDKFAFGNLSRRALRKCPACPIPPGILPLYRKKDPHHRRGRNSCPRRGSYPHRKDFDLSLGPHRRQGTRIWQRTDGPARTPICCRRTTTIPSYLRFPKARSPSFHGRVNNSESFLRLRGPPALPQVPTSWLAGCQARHSAWACLGSLGTMS